MEVVVVEKVESIGVDGVVSTRSIHRRGVGGWVAFVLVFKPFCKQFYLWSANTVLIEVNEDWKCVAANICRSID